MLQIKINEKSKLNGEKLTTYLYETDKVITTNRALYDVISFEFMVDDNKKDIELLIKMLSKYAETLNAH